MFTGIVEATAEVISHTKRDEITTLVLGLPSGWEVTLGQSIAVNGVCLTVVKFDTETFLVEMMQETLDKTIFSGTIPEKVNLERTMKADGRFDGHIVQGHVDAVGEVAAVEAGAETMMITMQYDMEFSKLVVEKGSMTVNGVSLTVVDAKPGSFSVWIIPHTITHTTLGLLVAGNKVNLEFDIVGKYILNTL